MCLWVRPTRGEQWFQQTFKQLKSFWNKLGWICIFSSYILICFRAAVRLRKCVTDLDNVDRYGGDPIEAFPVWGIKKKSLADTESEVSFYWHCYADNMLRFVLRVRQSSVGSFGSAYVTLHKHHVISIQGRKQILADKSWLNHF